jgi:hypothetical protein
MCAFAPWYRRASLVHGLRANLELSNPIMKILKLFLPAFLALALFACGSVAQSCPAGQHLEGNVCVANLSCGPGTRANGNACVPAAPAAACQPGSSLIGGQCVASKARVSCGAETTLVGNTCVPQNDAESPVDAAPDSPAVPFFEVRIAATKVLADGYTRLPVLVSARAADGSPIADKLVLQVVHPLSGSLKDTEVSVGPLGTAITEFIPCDGAFPSCPGKARITVSRASAPNTVLAESQEFELVAR